ncbi:hypothetical protein P7C70_g7611, partial [Phenoliferia sp. Uapishka_3]
MRRIFGGANIPTSSTSSSLASDSLPSPTYGTPSSRPISPPSLHRTISNASVQQHPSDPARSKGWFDTVTETLGGVTSTGIGGIVTRKRSSTSTTAQTLASTTGGRGGRASLDDERAGEDYGKLPFSGARLNGHGNGNGNGSEAGSRGGNANERMDDKEREEKEGFMVELLSGQAAVEAKEYDIMDWDEMQDIKKVRPFHTRSSMTRLYLTSLSIKQEHAILANRIATLTRSVALETKLRDSAVKLVRLSAPSSSSFNPNSSTMSSSSTSSRRPRATREQAEAQLATANAKLESLSSELYKVGWAESAIRTKLLKHTAGVLALSIRRREEEEQGLSPTTIPLHSRSVSAAQSLQSSRSTNGNGLTITPSTSRPLSPASSDTFSGASFFANNPSAFIPSTPQRGWTSPPPSATSATFPSSTSFPDSSALVTELEGKIADLKKALKEAKDGGEEALTKLEEEAQVEIFKARKGEDEAREEVEALRTETGQERREKEDLRREKEELRREIEVAREAVREVKDGQAGMRKELADAQREADDARKEVELLNSGATDSQRKGVEAREEATELAKEVSQARLEAEEAMNREEVARERIGELEETVRRLERAQEEAREEEMGRDGERDSAARGEVEELKEERQKLVQAIGDVLRRHRMRSILGPALRDLPSFDDTTPHVDLPSYLSTTLDTHFDRLSTHVSSLSSDLTSTAAEHSSNLTSLQTELRQAIEHREKWRGESSTHLRSLESLQVTHDSLKSFSDSQAARLDSLSSLEQSLQQAQTEDARLRSEISALQSKLVAADALQVEINAQNTKILKPLQDLWKSMPPLDTRTTVSNSEDLAVLKTAFELPAKRPIGNFLADVTGAGGKFTVESLTERVRVLLSEDARLVGVLVRVEGEVRDDRGRVEKSRKGEEEAREAARGWEKQVKELEERMEVSSNQEVTMLERLNDLTENLESVRSEKRKAELSLTTLQSTVSSLESTLASQLTEITRLTSTSSSSSGSSAKLSEVEAELNDAKDQLADLEAELEDAKKREQKGRTALLDQLSEVEQEVSSLKTQLRQEQRKKAKA